MSLLIRTIENFLFEERAKQKKKSIEKNWKKKFSEGEYNEKGEMKQEQNCKNNEIEIGISESVPNTKKRKYLYSI